MSPDTRGGHDLDPPPIRRPLSEQPGRFRGARMFDREMRLTLGGVDLTGYVRDVQVNVDQDYVQITDLQRIPGVSSMSMEITIEGPPDMLMGRRPRNPITLRTPNRLLDGYGGNCTCPACETLPQPNGASAPFATFDEAVTYQAQLGLQLTAEPVQDTHAFVQNEEDLPAQLCSECGMWPDHHNHITGSYACNCQECDPNGEEFGEAADITSSFRSAGHNPDRSHP